MSREQTFSLPPRIPDTLTVEQRVAIWRDLMDTSHELLLAGLRHRIGPEGDLEAAFRQWYQERMSERDRELYGIPGGDDASNL